MSVLRPIPVLALVLGLLAASAPRSASAQAFQRPSIAETEGFMAQVPPEVYATGVVQRVDNQVPLERVFTDSEGQRIALSEIIDGSVPVLLTLNYSNCPQLCSMVLNGVVANLKELSLEPNKDFKVITLSIDPNEDPVRMAATKARYLANFDREGAAEGWKFLRGAEPDIRAVADSVGFGYIQIAGTDPAEFSHPATLIVLTPKGHVSLYLTAIADDPQTLRLALVDASEGAIGNITDLFFTTCFKYDETRGKYAPIAIRIMSIGGAVFLVGFASLLITFRVLEKRRHAEETEQ